MCSVRSKLDATRLPCPPTGQLDRHRPRALGLLFAMVAICCVVPPSGGSSRSGAPRREIESASRLPEVGARPSLSATAARRDSRSDAPGDLRVAIEYPEPGREVVGPDARGFITGTAYLAREAQGAFEVYIAIDRSRSTRRPSGVDIDGDGLVGSRSRLGRVPLLGRVFDASTDPGDSVLAAEVRAAKTLLGQLDAQSTKVAIIAFSGDRDPRTRDAEILAPLTSRYEDLTLRLDELLEAGPRGETNLVDAVQVATLEIERAFLADRSAPVQRIVLLISDGVATLPATIPPPDRSQAAIDAAEDAAQVSARFFTYAAGEAAPLYQSTLARIAEVTGGVFENVAQPADLIASFQDLDLAQIASVEVRNVTTGQPSTGLLVDPYGTFGALVGLQPGANVLEVYARATTGAERREQVTVTYRVDSQAEPLPKRALERRGRLLKDKLLRLYAEEIDRSRDRKQRGDRRNVEIQPGAPIDPSR